jgi:hypothetical protein
LVAGLDNTVKNPLETITDSDRYRSPKAGVDNCVFA